MGAAAGQTPGSTPHGVPAGLSPDTDGSSRRRGGSRRRKVSSSKPWSSGSRRMPTWNRCGGPRNQGPFASEQPEAGRRPSHCGGRDEITYGNSFLSAVRSSCSNQARVVEVCLAAHNHGREYDGFSTTAELDINGKHRTYQRGQDFPDSKLIVVNQPELEYLQGHESRPLHLFPLPKTRFRPVLLIGGGRIPAGPCFQLSRVPRESSRE